MKRRLNKYGNKETTEKRMSINEKVDLLKNSDKTPHLHKLTRATIAWALEGHSHKIKLALDSILEKDPEAYINAITKLMGYAVPKLSSTEVNDKTTKKIEISVDDNANIDDIKKMLGNIGS